MKTRKVKVKKIKMSLRDLFACHAISVGILSDKKTTYYTYCDAAKQAYEIADALIDARKG